MDSRHQKRTMKRIDYGTATHEEISEGFKIAIDIALQIKKLPNPAVQNMVRELLSLIQIQAIHHA